MKNADDARELCAALATFLENFKNMRMETFEDGVLVEVIRAAETDQLMLVLKIEK